jgi:hypothetical protein
MRDCKKKKIRQKGNKKEEKAELITAAEELVITVGCGLGCVRPGLALAAGPRTRCCTHCPR